MSDFHRLIKCPRCWAINTPYTPYFKCYNCRYVDEKDVSYRVSENEEKQREKVKEIIKFLFDSFKLSIPLVEFPESSLNPDTGIVDWGWVNHNTNTAFIPRNTFFLPNDELTDTTVHEVCHLLSKEKGHGNYWRSLYLQQREKVFDKFSDFANSKNPQAKLEKGYKILPKEEESK